MSTILGPNIYPARSLGRDAVLWSATVTLGSAAIASQDVPDPGITFTRSSAGVYAVTFPACKKIRLFGSVLSAALTVVGVVVTALDATAGTATITVVNGAGAATDPATGNKVSLLAYCDLGG